MDLKNHRTSPASEKDGVRVPFDSETTFIIGSLNSPNYKKAFNDNIAAARKGRGDLTSEQLERATFAAYADAVFLGWEGVKDGGEELPYTKTAAIAMLTECPDVRMFVFTQAQNNANFLASRTEVAKEQLGKSSTGS